jgi:hypothetical protein
LDSLNYLTNTKSEPGAVATGQKLKLIAMAAEFVEIVF